MIKKFLEFLFNFKDKFLQNQKTITIIHDNHNDKQNGIETEMDLEQLIKIFPKTNKTILESYIIHINNTFDIYKINTILRQSAFIGQVGHESAELTTIRENLNYSAKALQTVFKKYFPGDLAYEYERKPEKIANRVYANRMGNGDENSGDGWRYRGRGLIQITGKNNYTLLSEEFDKKLSNIGEWLETPEGATLSAGWYWNTNNLNTYADKEDFIKITKLINGGLNGLEDRERIYKITKDILTHMNNLNNWKIDILKTK